MTKQVDKQVTFILSTGRTGTQFFSKYLNATCRHVLCLHEPRPSRRFKWYSNYFLKKKLSGSFVSNQYVNNRKKILKSSDIEKYVESSNFLFGCADAVKESIPNLSVIHIVRHPINYAVSHLNKGFWNGFKGFTARYIPGWLEFIDPKIKKSEDPVMILLARWIYVNNVLLSQKEKTNYLLIRFEDVFGNRAENSSEELNRVRNFLGCEPLEKKEQLQWLQRSANKSKKNRSAQWPVQQKHLEYIKQEGAELLEVFNYDIDQIQVKAER